MSNRKAEPKLIACHRHDGGLRMTAAFCGESWLRAQAATDVIERTRLAPCVDCSSGRRRAKGVEEKPARTRVWERWSIV
jgi:uncharacterized protein (DUF169 family)